MCKNSETNVLKFDGCCVKAKRRNFLYLVNILQYSQSCFEPFQHNRDYIYLKDGYIYLQSI